VAVGLISFNSYLGESTMLSLSSQYEKKELKFWSIGTGLASILGSGVYLLLSFWIDTKYIFAINFISYILGLSIGLFLIHYQHEEQIQISEIELAYSDMSSNSIISEYKLSRFIRDIYLLILAYLFGYLIGFSYIPLIMKNDLNYETLQFVSRSCLFLGRTVGNYISLQYQIIFAYIHLYTFMTIIVYTFLLIFQVSIPIIIFSAMLSISYLNIGISYPIVYHNVYERYADQKEWAMGAVGRFTSFATIMGCSIGYVIEVVFMNRH
jgi:hypothetical protein